MWLHMQQPPESVQFNTVELSLPNEALKALEANTIKSSRNELHCKTLIFCSPPGMTDDPCTYEKSLLGPGLHVTQSGFKLLASSDPLTSASQSARITGVSHHARLIFIYIFCRDRFHHVAQAGLRFLKSTKSLSLPSESNIRTVKNIVHNETEKGCSPWGRKALCRFVVADDVLWALKSLLLALVCWPLGCTGLSSTAWTPSKLWMLCMTSHRGCLESVMCYCSPDNGFLQETREITLSDFPNKNSRGTIGSACFSVSAPLLELGKAPWEKQHSSRFCFPGALGRWLVPLPGPPGLPLPEGKHRRPLMWELQLLRGHCASAQLPPLSPTGCGEFFSYGTGVCHVNQCHVSCQEAPTGIGPMHTVGADLPVFCEWSPNPCRDCSRSMTASDCVNTKADICIVVVLQGRPQARDWMCSKELHEQASP
ncbi:hypothetical protein AAY473_001279 [Plecturocebus cupreus]